ncbi:hypothetical protein B0J13DRAFT_616905 [Dactylonectria estremocensis]|uniref:Uncharacterized protein n=1 Tax=Dactylonectria estremocensis TaxID=1079267 RepID=A0A9P9FFG8_9HYPO|nr:hypothetical protein B0J13DRAFT_616905 [Dactylonectria estremocensis]
MFNSRFETVSGRFSPSRIGRSFRRSSRSSARDSYSSSTSVSSSASTINSIILRQPSLPRPIVYWGGVEERMGSLHF